MKYLIFSDESGSWHEEGYYIRSWIRITPTQYPQLQKEIIFAKYKNGGIKELKWDKFKKNSERFKTIFDVDFKIFVTITKTDHFKPQNYNIIKAIEEFPTSTGGPKLTGKIKNKIINSVKNELFLNYFEKTHIENSKDALLLDEKPEEYKYSIDTPQYLNREWEEIAKECGINNVEIIKKSEKCPGIELADIVCGCISGKIQNNKKAETIYTEFIKPKMLDMYTSKIPNPNLIFYNDFSEEEKKKLNIFR